MFFNQLEALFSLVSVSSFVVKPLCAKHWNGINATCDKLVNGTNASWLKPLRRGELCKLFAKCFHSETLEARCIDNFLLYYNIFNYSELSLENASSQLQITYKKCDGGFFTNIIRCDSIDGSNESGTFMLLGQKRLKVLVYLKQSSN